MKRGAVDHFKMRRLARALQVPLYAANGLVMRLLHFTADHAPRGDVGRFNDQDIADACCWDREPAELVGGFTESGWLDRHPQCRLAVHDWYEHAEDSVHARVWRDRGWFMTGEQPRLRKLEEKERAKATAFYAEHQAPNAAEAAAAGSRESLDGCHSAPNGASPLPPPLPLPEGKRETAPDARRARPRPSRPTGSRMPIASHSARGQSGERAGLSRSSRNSRPRVSITSVARASPRPTGSRRYGAGSAGSRASLDGDHPRRSRRAHGRLGRLSSHPRTKRAPMKSLENARRTGSGFCTIAMRSEALVLW
jgi:hypothetical protein